MSRIFDLFGRRVAIVAAALALVAHSESLAVGIDDYQLIRSFSMPAPIPSAGGNVLMDTLPDGRLLLLNGAEVSVETAPKSGAFSSVASVADFAPDFGASFMTVSPDGTRAAIGSNDGHVLVFSTSHPETATSHIMADFSGEWFDNQFLAVANSDGGGGVQILNTADGAITSVISNIHGASAGVAFDAAGNLYTGNGSGSSPGSETGWIKAFPFNQWHAAMTGTPLNFETEGTPIADLLTAYPIGFDTAGNMFVGGGEMFNPTGDKGYAALIDAAAIAGALGGQQTLPPIDSTSPTGRLRKFDSPLDTITQFQPPNWNYNAATGELYLNYAYGNGNVDVYVAVPEPSCILLTMVCGMLLLTHRIPRS